MANAQSQMPHAMPALPPTEDRFDRWKCRQDHLHREFIVALNPDYLALPPSIAKVTWPFLTLVSRLTFPTIDRGSPATDPIQEENNEGRTTGRKKNGRNRTENSQHGQNTILPWQTDPGNFWNPDMTMLGWWNLADNPLILDFLGQSAHQSTYPYPQHIDEAELYGYDDENADGCRADRPG